MEAVNIYAMAWATFLVMLILHGRVYWVKGLVSPLLMVLQRPWLVPAFEANCSVESVGFPIYPEIRLPGGLLLLLSNVLVLTLFPGPSMTRTLHIRSGQLAVVNLIPLFLFSLRHSPLASLANFCQPEVLWAHYTLGIMVYLELGLHLMVGISSQVDSQG